VHDVPYTGSREVDVGCDPFLALGGIVYPVWQRAGYVLAFGRRHSGAGFGILAPAQAQGKPTLIDPDQPV
jgi:hypothetical protein